jgi:hypothetical protein
MAHWPGMSTTGPVAAPQDACVSNKYEAFTAKFQVSTSRSLRPVNAHSKTGRRSRVGAMLGHAEDDVAGEYETEDTLEPPL